MSIEVFVWKNTLPRTRLDLDTDEGGGKPKNKAVNSTSPTDAKQGGEAQLGADGPITTGLLTIEVEARRALEMMKHNNKTKTK